MPSVPGRRWSWIVPWLFLLVGIFGSLRPMIFQSFAVIPGGLLDTRLVHFTLEHGHRSLMSWDADGQFWDPPIFFPARNVTSYTDVLVAFLPFYSPWRWLGLDPDVAFQLWFIVVLALSFATFYAFLKSLGCGVVGASAGAFLFAFGSSRLANLNHPQLLPGFFIALALLALSRFFGRADVPSSLKPSSSRPSSSRPSSSRPSSFVRSSRFWIAVFFMALVAQAYGAFYPFYLFVFCVACVAVVACVRGDSRSRLIERLRDHWRFILLMAVASTALIAPLAGRYIMASELLGSRPWEAVEPLLPRWTSWFLMGTTNTFYGWLQETGFVLSQGPSMRTGTHSNGLGFLSLVAIVCGWYIGRKRSVVRILLPATAMIVLLTTVLPGGQTLWRFFFEWLPGASAVRAMGRIGMMFLIPGAVGLALVFDELSRRRRFALLAVLALVVVGEHAHESSFYDKAEVRQRVATLADEVARVDAEDDCLAFYVSTIRERRYSPIHEDAEWAALDLGLPTINGRYGNDPPHWQGLAIAHRPPGKAGHERLAGMTQSLEGWVRINGLRPERICWIELDADGTGHRRPVAGTGP